MALQCARNTSTKTVSNFFSFLLDLACRFGATDLRTRVLHGTERLWNRAMIELSYMRRKTLGNGRERLSRRTIERRYRGEWVLLGDPELDREERVKRAAVVAHSADKDEVVRAAIANRLKSAALLYMGPIADPDVAIIL